MMTRREINDRIRAQPWFQASPGHVQRQLLDLPGESTVEDRAEKRPDRNCNGFLEHLANRPAEGGGVRLTSIREMLIPKLQNGLIFGILVVMNVEKIDGSLPFTYQYFSWRQGPKSGSKGVVLVRDAGGAMSHVVTLRAFSFGPGEDTFDAVGGFFEPNETGVAGALKRFDVELREELGMPEVRIAEVIPLGSFHPDRGMTNNRPDLFAAVIDASEASRIPEGKHVNPDPREMRSVPVIIPIAKLWGKEGFLQLNDDSYFLACLARLIGRGLIRPPADLP